MTVLPWDLVYNPPVDIHYQIYILRAVELGLADAAAGCTIPHERVEEELRKQWLLNAEE